MARSGKLILTVTVAIVITIELYDITRISMHWGITSARTSKGP